MIPRTLRIYPDITEQKPFNESLLRPVEADAADLKLAATARAFASIGHADAMDQLGLIDPMRNGKMEPHELLYMSPDESYRRHIKPGGTADKAVHADGETFGGLLGKYNDIRQARVFDLAMPNVARQMVNEHFKGSRADAAQALADPNSRTGRLLGSEQGREQVERLTGRADADLNAPDGLEANLTALGYMLFYEPLPPQQYDEFFQLNGGWNPGMLNIQLLMIANSGEAKAWQDGGGDDNVVSVGGMSPVTLQIYHFLSTATIGYLQEQRSNVLRMDLRNQADKQGRLAHRLVQDRYAFIGGTDVPMPALATLPIGTFSSGLNVGASTTATADQLFGSLQRLYRFTNDQQSMAVTSNCLDMSSAIMTAAKSIRFPAGGDFVFDALQKQNPGIKMREFWRLKNMDGAAVETAIAHNDQDPNSSIMWFQTPVVALPIWQTLQLNMAYVSSAAGAFMAAPMAASKRTYTNT